MKCSTAVQHYIGTNYTATAVHHAHKVFIENTECLMLKKKWWLWKAKGFINSDVMINRFIHSEHISSGSSRICIPMLWSVDLSGRKIDVPPELILCATYAL